MIDEDRWMDAYLDEKRARGSPTRVIDFRIEKLKIFTEGEARKENQYRCLHRQLLLSFFTFGFYPNSYRRTIEKDSQNRGRVSRSHRIRP